MREPSRCRHQDLPQRAGRRAGLPAIDGPVGRIDPQLDLRMSSRGGLDDALACHHVSLPGDDRGARTPGIPSTELAYDRPRPQDAAPRTERAWPASPAAATPRPAPRPWASRATASAPSTYRRVSVSLLCERSHFLQSTRPVCRRTRRRNGGELTAGLFAGRPRAREGVRRIVRRVVRPGRVARRARRPGGRSAQTACPDRSPQLPSGLEDGVVHLRQAVHTLLSEQGEQLVTGDPGPGQFALEDLPVADEHARAQAMAHPTAVKYRTCVPQCR